MIEPQAHAVLEPAATQIRDPISGRSVWRAGMISQSELSDDRLAFVLTFKPEHSAEARQRIEESLARNLRAAGWAGELEIKVRELGAPAPSASPAPAHSHTHDHAHAPAHAPAPSKPAPQAIKGLDGHGMMQPHGGPISKTPIPGVRHVIAVASGKGGVGKSTVATNLAVALELAGYRTGLMDADIYGPSLPLMMNVHGRPFANAEKKILPLEGHGVRCMSIGFLVDDKEPIIWRGPMVMGVVKQFLHDVAWGELDVLIIDLPPGTGDAQLTMIQAVPLSGAVVVTTPQEVALLDAVRAIEMFRKLDVPVLGIVENMSWMDLPDGSRIHPFGQGGGGRTAESYGVPLLGQVPLDGRVREGGDAGRPVTLDPIPAAAIFRGVADAVARRLALES